MQPSAAVRHPRYSAALSPSGLRAQQDRAVMFRYALIVVLLCAASSISLARDVQMHGANGDGGSEVCPDQAPAATPKRAPAVRSGKAKAPASLRGGDSTDAGVRAPRWHSFLPGMFR
jgi:hypothetical protein